MNKHLKLMIYWIIGIIYFPIGLNILIYVNNPFIILISIIFLIILICLMFKSLIEIMRE